MSLAIAFFTSFRHALAFTSIGRAVTFLAVSRVTGRASAALFVDVTYIEVSIKAGAALLSSIIIALTVTAVFVRVAAADLLTCKSA